MHLLLLFPIAAFALPNLFRHAFFPSATGFYTLPGLSRTSDLALYYTPYTNLSESVSMEIPVEYKGVVGAACVGVQDCVYCFGGFTVTTSKSVSAGDGMEGLIPAGQLMWTVNLTSKVWETLAPGTPTFFYSALAIPARVSLSAAANVTGGSDVYIYAGPGESFVISPGDMMNSPVMNATSLAPAHLESGCMLATPGRGVYIGGTTPGETVSSVYAINTTTLVWSLVATNMTGVEAVEAPGLTAMTCVVKGENVYVFGGNNGSYSGVMYMYAMVHGGWKVVGDDGVWAPGARVWAASIVLGKYVMVHGGIRADGRIE